MPESRPPTAEEALDWLRINVERETSLTVAWIGDKKVSDADLAHEQAVARLALDLARKGAEAMERWRVPGDDETDLVCPECEPERVVACSSCRRDHGMPPLEPPEPDDAT